MLTALSRSMPDIMTPEVEAEILRIRAQAEVLKEQLEHLEVTLRHARGTAPDLAMEAAAAALPPAALPEPPPPPPSLPLKVELALMHESLSTEALVRAVGEPTGRVVELLRKLRQEHRVHNVGSAEHPVWTWRIGDLTSTPVLQAMVRRLISERPMTTRELVEATGARLPRVGGVMVALQRGKDRVLNLGSPGTGRWFIVGERALDANLSTKPPIRRRRHRRDESQS